MPVGDFVSLIVLNFFLSFFPQRESVRYFWTNLVEQTVFCAPANSPTICQAISCFHLSTSALVLSRRRFRSLLFTHTWVRDVSPLVLSWLIATVCTASFSKGNWLCNTCLLLQIPASLAQSCSVCVGVPQLLLDASSGFSAVLSRLYPRENPSDFPGSCCEERWATASVSWRGSAPAGGTYNGDMKEGKGRGNFAASSLFHSGQYVCNEEGLLAGWVTTPSVIGLHPLPQ